MKKIIYIGLFFVVTSLIFFLPQMVKSAKTTVKGLSRLPEGLGVFTHPYILLILLAIAMLVITIERTSYRKPNI